MWYVVSIRIVIQHTPYLSMRDSFSDAPNTCFHFFRLEKENIRRNQHQKPPDAEEQRDAPVKENAARKEPPSNMETLDPETERNEDLKSLGEEYDRIVEPWGKIHPRNGKAERRRPAAHEAEQEDPSALPVRKEKLLPADAEI